MSWTEVTELVRLAQTGDRVAFGELVERFQGAVYAMALTRVRDPGEAQELAQEVFVHAMVPPARVLIIGATHIGQILAQLVKIAGYEVVVIDPRTAFAAEARFPGIRLDTKWPQDTIPKIGLDPYTAVVALAHVGHIDDEALKLAMRSESFYVGALGSRRNHAKRTQRLAEAGFNEAEIKRIHSPIGIPAGFVHIPPAAEWNAERGGRTRPFEHIRTAAARLLTSLARLPVV